MLCKVIYLLSIHLLKFCSVKRYAKLISDEKENATKLGFLDGGTPTKKRTAAATGGAQAAKKAKKEVIAEEKDNRDDGKNQNTVDQDEEAKDETGKDED